VGYLVFVAVVLGINVLPAFAPPTWAAMVLFRLNSGLNGVALVLLGTAAAITGRLVLATTVRRARYRLAARRLDNLEAAADLVRGSRRGSLAGLALFLLSPVPSGQLFVAAGLLGVRLRPLAAAFVAGRLVSNTLYVTGASAASRTHLGELVLSSFRSPWGIALQVLLLAGVAVVPAVDWSVRARTSASKGSSSVPS
jgi:uncharacterized membrane protein YdjX (TVP38/TMEM64 family)